MEIEEDAPMSIPEWVVTFGDMMSLLLTFFIMLVSMSEIKKDEQFQAMVESMRRQFGPAKSISSTTPGDAQPRKSSFKILATEGRAKRKDTASGGVPDPAPQGEENRVRIIRQGKQTSVGSVIFFDTFSDELTPQAKRDLDNLVKQLQGKPQKIEVRGHSAPEVAARATDHGDSMDLGYARCRAVMDYLVKVAKLEPNRFRLASAGDFEPMFTSGNADKMRMNPRVEVFLLDENSRDLENTGDAAANSNTSIPPETPVE